VVLGHGGILPNGVDLGAQELDLQELWVFMNVVFRNGGFRI
jgi:hypothetical protein